ncbi:MAG: hypothetical protein DRP47_10820 [Candidatus Zixiibacteriota bacterium]|nr:MAG: hypothetical protein DRP47_10820 [candidate division Zixibacteria bacterium]
MNSIAGCFSRIILFCFLLVSFTGLIPSSVVHADPPLVVLDVVDTSIALGQNNVYISVFLSNYYDTIAGFQFQLEVDRPDLVTFNFDNDGFDTTGTLLSGFEYVQAIDTSLTGHLLWFRCIANADPFDGINTPGIPPQQEGLVVRLPINTTVSPDTTAGLTCHLTIVSPFDFSDPWGNSLGVITDTLTDTIYYKCVQWEADSCLEWIMVDGYTEEYDSVYIYDYLSGYLDTTVVIPSHGSITVVDAILVCDNDDSGDITIADLTCLVTYLFGGGDPVRCPLVEYCCSGGSGEPNISDLTMLVNYLFTGGPPPS